MYVKKLFSITLSLALITGLCAADPSDEKPQSEESSPQVNINKVSRAFGHMIGKNLETLGMNFDMQEVIVGIQDSMAGKTSPLSEEECVQAITQMQEMAFKKQADENLVKAEEFLAKNSMRDGIIQLEEGKVQYKLEQEGKGDIVKEEHAPTIRYVGKFLDGSVFGESKEDEVVTLSETIAGLKKGIVGMKEGEKRTIFIHPQLAYGSSGYLPPNSLLTFEVECVKANTEASNEEVIAQSAEEQASPELAESNQEEAVR